MTRADRLAERLAEREIDVLLVDHLVNVRYLTGFTGTNGLAVIGEDVRRFVTDFRYLEQVAEQAPGWDVVRATRDVLEGVPEALPSGRDLRIGFEDQHLSVRRHGKLAELVADRGELVAAGGLVEELRTVKDAGELRAIREAAELADQAFRAAVARGLAGRTEKGVAFELEQEIRRRGAEPSFPSIVASGAHGALPHAVPRAVDIPRNTLVVVDWGAQLDGYCSDCTRTLATGALDDEAEAVYELVKRAQRAGLDAVRAGVGGREADAGPRRLIEEAGYGEYFGHGLGHGVGLEVHEDPRLSKTSEDTLAAGNVVSVEPGVYLPGRFGVRIEDLVVVTDEGVDVISGLGKDLTNVG